MPMLVDGNSDSGQPIPLFHQLNKLRCGKEFHSVLRRIAQRLEKFGSDEDRHVMKLTTEQPSDLLNIEPRRRLANQSKEFVLVFLHGFLNAVAPEYFPLCVDRKAREVVNDLVSLPNHWLNSR